MDAISSLIVNDEEGDVQEDDDNASDEASTFNDTNEKVRKQATNERQEPLRVQRFTKEWQFSMKYLIKVNQNDKMKEVNVIKKNG